MGIIRIMDQERAKNINRPKRNNAVVNGLFKKNAILVSGMVIAPVVFFDNTFYNGLTLALIFSLITFFTLIISSFIPQKIVYTIRIILYTLIASVVYIPIIKFLNEVIPQQITEMGIFVPLLITNSFIISKSEIILFKEKRTKMFADLFFGIIGYDLIVILYGAVRELISIGQIAGQTLGMSVLFEPLSASFGGFILLGLSAALFRFILLIVRSVEK